MIRAVKVVVQRHAQDPVGHYYRHYMSAGKFREGSIVNLAERIWRLYKNDDHRDWLYFVASLPDGRNRFRLPGAGRRPMLPWNIQVLTCANLCMLTIEDGGFSIADFHRTVLHLMKDSDVYTVGLSSCCSAASRLGIEENLLAQHARGQATGGRKRHVLLGPGTHQRFRKAFGIGANTRCTRSNRACKT
jgi:hypothetical protein